MNVLMKSDCRKFSPNIFNKSKCQNCFRTKEAHTAEALECNRATRKVAKCGYLFVAPDWDFTVSINRTKRWQRRWFILYDDGELTYSVDEHPNTIPQALIDMNKVVEVSDAEQVTGNQFSLAITAPERVHFVKGTSRDETKWWYDLLSHYPHGTVRARHKRNATFSGSTTTNNNQQEQIVPTIERYCRSQSFSETNNNNINNNNKNTSGGVELQWVQNTEDSKPGVQIEVAKEILEPLQNGGTGGDDKRSNNLSRTEEIENLNNLILSSLNSLTPINNQPKESEITSSLDSKNGNLIKSASTTVIPSETEPAKGHSRRYVKRENRGLRSQRSRSDGVAKMIPSSANNGYQGSLPRNSKHISEPLGGESHNCHQNPVYLLLTESKPADVTDGIKRTEKSPLSERKRHASMGQEKSKEQKSKTTVNNAQEESTELAEPSFLQSPLLVRRNSLASTRGLSKKHQEERSSPILPRGTPFTRLDCSPLLSRRSKPCSRNNSFRKETNSPSPQIRGDPDGCQPNQDMLVETGKNGAVEKKGWLLRLGIHKEWYKHWFVLKNSTLSYFRDPGAENSGIMDGILDLGLVKDVQETASDRNHAFCVTTWDNKKHVLAAMMPTVRASWVEEIILAANLGTKGIRRSKSKSECQDEQSEVPNLFLPLLDERQDKGESTKGKPGTPITADCASSTSSSDDHSEYFSVVDEDDLASRSSSPKALPPSPPINRTAISRVKQKARSRSSSRTRMGNRKLRSSSDVSSTSWEGGDAEEGAQSDTETVTTSPPSKADSTKDVVLQSTPVARDASSDSISQDSADGLIPGTYRTLVDKYNYLRKQLDEHSVCDLSATPLSAEGILKLLADCRVCLSRVQEALRKKGIVSSDDLGGEWKLFKSVCSELDKLVRDPNSEEHLTQKDITELSVAVQKAREEIRKLKKDLKCSQDSFDDLELHCYKLKQDVKNTSENHKSQMSLMTARVDDLTSKLTSSERSLRLAKQRVAKLEARQERRRSSLKGKEAVSLSKEFEGKLTELEQKIGTIETSLLSSAGLETPDALTSKNKTNQEGLPTETSSTNMLLRLHSLDSKVKSTELVATATSSSEPSIQESSSQDSIPSHLQSLEKPKICLQVKGSLNDDSASYMGADDGIEHWSSLSVTTSMSDLHTIEPEEELPGTMEECLNGLTQKLDILLTWLQGSFRLLGNPSSYSLCGNDQRLPPEHADAARKLEELLSNRGGMDESTSDLVFYLHLLQEAAVSVKRLAEPHVAVWESHKMKPLLARLKRAGMKVNLILDLESQPLDFLDCVQKLLRLATPSYESGTAGITSEEVSLFLETLLAKLDLYKNSKLDELPAEVLIRDNTSGEANTKELYHPLWDVENELIELLEHYGPSCCNEFASNPVSPSSNDITPIKVLKLEMETLRNSLDKQINRWNPSFIERLAVITTVHALLRVIHPSLQYNDCCISEEGGKWSLNIVVGMLEIMLVRWTSQLILTTASSLSDVLRSKDVEVSELKSVVESMKEEDKIQKALPCLTCCDLQKQVCRLQSELRAYQRRVGQGGTQCERCRELHRRLEILSERHQMELAAAVEREREEHRAEMQSRLSEVMLSHDAEKSQDQEEVAQLRRDVRISESQVKALKKQFQEQMSTLKSAYEEKMANTSTESLSLDSRRQLQAEIQDIKCFCMKGLEAVEQSHRLRLEELMQIHQQELEVLKKEKDKALAEETQATAVAIEALRRTHKEELKRALDKLREDFLKKPESLGSAVNQNCCHLEGIKTEILSLSEKYSIKCLEYSLLEEKLNSLSRQLQQSSQQVFELLINNQAASGSTDPDDVRENHDYSDTSSDKLRQLLELRESQLQVERDERAKLAKQLHNARSDLALLDVKCQQLIQRHCNMSEEKISTTIELPNDPSN